jgi:hypothetical protein
MKPYLQVNSQSACQASSVDPNLGRQEAIFDRDKQLYSTSQALNFGVGRGEVHGSVCAIPLWKMDSFN